MSAERLRINEIFHSIQGEGTRAGMPCVFIRLTGCHLRCTYCDTEYAFYEGGWMTLNEIVARVRDYGCGMVEVTGGEPLLQPAVYPLMKRLADEFETVLLETSGAVPIDKVDAVGRRRHGMTIACLTGKLTGGQVRTEGVLLK